MTKELGCTICDAPATLTKTLPLCSRCGLKIAEETLGFVFDGLRNGSGVVELPAAPKSRMSPAEADDVAHQKLAALKRSGAKEVTYRDLKPLLEVTGRSRGWVYAWLDARVADGTLTKDTSRETHTYAFAY